MPLPTLTDTGELPVGVHSASLKDILEQFSAGSSQRRVVAIRLERIYDLAISSGYVARFIVFGSFVTSAPEPNDVDIFLLMDNGFDASQMTGESRLLFDHAVAQTHFGASVFWLRRLAAWEGEQAAVEYWQVKRGGGKRGIVEIVPEEV